MDTQRLLVLISLFFVTFLLWEAWQKDYGPKPQFDTLPTAADEISNGSKDSDVPTVDLSGGQSYTSAATPRSTKSARYSDGNAVTVNTDTFDLKISLRGGDIIEAKLAQYKTELKDDAPLFTLLNYDSNTEYVAQSGLISEQGPDSLSGERQILTANQPHYEMAAGQDELVIPLYWTNGDGITIEKRFTFRRGSYLIGVSYHIDNQSGDLWRGKFYSQLKRKAVEPKRQFFGVYTFFGAAYSSPEQHYEKLSFGDMQDSPLDEKITGGWLSMIQHYFVTAWVPDATQEAHFYSRALGENRYRLGFTLPTLEVLPGEQKTTSSTLFVGPKIQEQLEEAAPYLNLTVDYGWLWFLCLPLFWLLKWCHTLVNNWGWAIVMVTFIVKALFFHFSATSYRSMAKLRKVQPKLLSLRERFGDDRQKMSQAMMELYKKEKVNPLGGCLPILIQIPVFIALYWVLLESVELRHAPFMLWIHDLSSRDPYFVLPVLMAVTMFLQQMLSPAPVDPVHAKLMKVFPVVFMFFFMFFPAGLVLYWFISNVLSILQQWLITRVVMKESK